MNTPTYDRLQVIEAIHGATVSEEFDRVQAKLSDGAIQAEIIRLYKAEILLAERLVTAWKKQFPKDQRPIQYTAKKELVKVLKDEITYWQGGADWANAENNGSAEAEAPAVTAVPDSLSLRQVAMLYYYSAKPLTENNAAAIAASEGFTSKTSGKQLVDKYTEFCVLQDSELPTDLKALKHLEKALTGLLPRLEGQAKQNAAAYLKGVIR